MIEIAAADISFSQLCDLSRRLTNEAGSYIDSDHVWIGVFSIGGRSIRTLDGCGPDRTAESEGAHFRAWHGYRPERVMDIVWCSATSGAQLVYTSGHGGDGGVIRYWEPEDGTPSRYAVIMRQVTGSDAGRDTHDRRMAQVRQAESHEQEARRLQDEVRRLRDEACRLRHAARPEPGPIQLAGWEQELLDSTKRTGEGDAL